jgi:hypothetical protein
MPRTLPAALTTAMDSGVFKAYLAIGQRNYTGVPPVSLSGYTTLITTILYYKYDGLDLTIKWASPNLPEDDGLTLGSKYYIERGVTIAGVNHTIKSASLRFDDYTINKQIITATFSLFPEAERPDAIAGDNPYNSVLGGLNPNAYYLGTVDFKDTPENANHWNYKFYATGKQVILKSYRSLLPIIQQKYLLQATDNSDDNNEDEIQFFHLQSPIVDRYWREGSGTGQSNNSLCWSEELGLFASTTSSITNSLVTSPDGINWTPRTLPSSGAWVVTWAAELGLFIACGDTAGGAPLAATSPDGITWTSRTRPDEGQIYTIAWSAELSLIVAAGYETIQTSPDGITWTSRSSPISNPANKFIYALAWSPSLSRFVAVGDEILYSSNGITWTDNGTADTGVSLAWSPTLSLFAMAVNLNNIKTSPDGITWTSRTADINAMGVAWSPEVGVFCATVNGTQTYLSSDGITWTPEGAFTSDDYKFVVWANSLNSFLVLVQTSPTSRSQLSIEAFTVNHTIEQGDVILKTDNISRGFLWRDEAGTIHTTGDTNDVIHNLGYLESTDDPPASFENADRASVIIGIHLKYKTGDIFQLKINDTQTATYLGKVTEILDPDTEIGWRCEIELIERFANTDGGPLPSTIERVAAYTPLVTTNFNGNLDETVNNLQAFADKVDDLSLPDAPIDTPTATNDFLIGSQVASIWTWVKNTLAQTITVLRTSLDAVYAPIAKGVDNGNSHNHVGGDGAALNYSDVLACFLNGVSIPASTTYYAAPFKVGADGTSNQFPWPEAGTLRDCYFRISAAQSGTGSLVATLTINGVAKSIVVTIAAGSAAGTYSDTTHTESLAAGDLVKWDIQNNATVGGATMTALSMKLVKQTT